MATKEANGSEIEDFKVVDPMKKQEEKWVERSIIRGVAYWALAFPATFFVWVLWWWVNLFPW